MFLRRRKTPLLPNYFRNVTNTCAVFSRFSARYTPLWYRHGSGEIPDRCQDGTSWKRYVDDDRQWVFNVVLKTYVNVRQPSCISPTTGIVHVRRGRHSGACRVVFGTRKRENAPRDESGQHGKNTRWGKKRLHYIICWKREGGCDLSS